MTDATTSARRRMLRGARFALHLITGVLVVIATVRAGSEQPLLPVMLASTVYLAWYAAGAGFARGRAAGWWMLGLGAIWAGLLALSPEYVWLAFPLLLLAGHVLRLPWSAPFVVGVLAAAILAPFLHPGAVAPGTSLAHLFGPLIGGGFAFAVSLGYDALLRDAAERERLIDSLLRAQHEAERLHDELAATQREAGATRERTRLARDLHDTIAQELSSIVMLARAEEPDGTRPRSTAQIEELAQHSLTELRRIVAALAPADLDESALADALARMLDAVRADTAIGARLRVDPDLPALPTPVEVALLRVAQSALANVRRHAQAQNVEIVLEAKDGSVVLGVADDGIGFDPAARPSDASYGLAAMRSRLREGGGELEIRTAPGEGTTIRAALPLPRGEA
ncbi:sensor histidine kinase [Microbacterium capsulatum]|uniref:Oxygen sensor histidine kinase NreB n=1 Tax=Microbacterium capsulatum TaxID=3041921 RepID=A0ABU0XGW5_9MICO|nr:sensor histidine kinase [Microbacterium sp. ASV81]MDQ4214373.1 sensor histidine kinase [Microbacterium sp. ASV81]